MRGKEGRRPCVVGVPGITPAYAGKSVINGSEWLSSRDHPRICGEKTWGFVQAGLPVGSPPHMRGKETVLGSRVSTSGITPAYAGKSVNRYHDYFSSRDHPRICGEKDLSKNFILPELGSPPHMRGKGIKPCYQRVTVGITPAYAGKRSLLSFLIAS